MADPAEIARRRELIVRVPCAMSGYRETLTVKATGPGGVSFIYGDDASVIVDGDYLIRIKKIIDAQVRAIVEQGGGA